MRSDDKKTMCKHWLDTSALSEAWLMPDFNSDEPTRIYWRLVKQASDLWLEHNAPKKPHGRKAKR